MNDTWSIASGALPAGITISSATGELSGTPTTAGRYAFVVSARDSVSGFVGTHRYFLTVGIGISPATLPNGASGVAYSQQLTAIGATGATTWSVSAGALPPGVTLTVGGLIAGVPL